MSVAAPITTLAGHIAALQRAGAVAIWPLDETTISAGQNFRELSGNNWAMLAGYGQGGLAGPYPDATAHLAGNNYWDFGVTISAQNPWPSSFGQPAMTVAYWVLYPNEVPNAIYATIVMYWAGGSPARYDPLSAGWHTGPVIDGSADVTWGASVIQLNGQELSDLVAGRWTHVTSVLDQNQIRLYLNGTLFPRSGTLSPPAGTARPTQWQCYSDQPGRAGFQALALFDRALTGQEVMDLHYETPSPAAGAAKIWNGSDWQPAAIKGWTGSEWAPAKIWTGDNWQEV